jgi:hypothetical protein
MAAWVLRPITVMACNRTRLRYRSKNLDSGSSGCLPVGALQDPLAKASSQISREVPGGPKGLWVRDWRFCPSTDLMGMSNHFDNYDLLRI